MPLTDTQVRNAKPTGKTQRLFDGEGLLPGNLPKGRQMVAYALTRDFREPSARNARHDREHPADRRYDE
jgi:hypothetical protein